MEKAKLTREQDCALKMLLQSKVYAEDLGLLITRQADQISRQVGWAGFYSALDTLSVDELCRALYVGYEIEEEDQVFTVTAEVRKSIQNLPGPRAEGPYKEGFDFAVKLVLGRLGITIKGINA